MACLILGKVRNKEGEIVDSILYEKLKKILPKDLAMKYYYIFTSEQFKNDPNYPSLTFDENDEPTLESLLEHTILKEDISENKIKKSILNELPVKEVGTRSDGLELFIRDIINLNKKLSEDKEGKQFYRICIVRDYDENEKKYIIKAEVYKATPESNVIWDDKLDTFLEELIFLNNEVKEGRIPYQAANSIVNEAAKNIPKKSQDFAFFNEDVIYNTIRNFKNKDKNDSKADKTLIAVNSKIFERVQLSLMTLSVDDWIKFCEVNNLDISEDELRNNFDKYRDKLYSLVRKKYELDTSVLDFISNNETREYVEKKIKSLRDQVDKMWSSVSIPPKKEKPDRTKLIDELKKDDDKFIDIEKIIKELGEEADIYESTEKAAIDLLKKIISAEYNEDYIQSRIGADGDLFIDRNVRKNIIKSTISLYEDGEYGVALFQYYISMSNRLKSWYDLLKTKEGDGDFEKIKQLRQIHYEIVLFKQISEYFRKNSSKLFFNTNDIRDKILGIFKELFPDKKERRDVLNLIKENRNEFVEKYAILESLADAYWETMQTRDNEIFLKPINDKLIIQINDISDEVYKREKYLIIKILNKFQPNNARITPFGENKGKINNIEELLSRAERDMWGIERLLDSMAESPDMILRLIDHITKRFKNTARLRAIEFARKVKMEATLLEQAGIYDTKWMYKKDDNNIKTGRYITINDAEYNDIKNNPAKLRFYNFFIDSKEMLDGMYPPNTIKSNSIINIRKDFMERIKNSNNIVDMIHSYTESVKDEWLSKNSSGEDIEGYSHGTYTLEGEEVNVLPIYYQGIDFENIKELNEISDDAVSTLIAYGAKSMDYDEMNKIVNTIELTKELLKDREIPVMDRGQKVISFVSDQLYKESELSDKFIYQKDNGTSNLSKRLQGYLDCVYYAKTRKGDKNIGKFSAIKIIDKFNAWTARATMSLSLLNGISNVTTGTAMMIYETFSKKYFKSEDYLWAQKTYAENLVPMLGNLGSRIKDDKLSLFTELFDVTNEYDKSMLNNVEWDKRTKMGRMEIGEALMFMQNAGEHWMSHMTALSVAHSIHLLDNEGNHINLWDAMEVKYIQEDGSYGNTNKHLGAKLVLKENIVKLDGSKFTSNDIIKTQTKISGINHKMHGVYNKIDMNLIQTTAVGRAAYLFRKWMWSSANKRFSKLNYDYETQEWDEGYYRSAGRFFLTIFKDIKHLKFNVALHWNELHPIEQANIRQALIETANLLSVISLNLFVDWDWDDDSKEKNSWAYNMFLYQSIRLQSELSSLTPWGVAHESIRLLKSPFPAITTLDNFMTTFKTLWIPNWFEEQEYGMFKGYSKGLSYLLSNKMINPIYQIGWRTANVETQMNWYKQ